MPQVGKEDHRLAATAPTDRRDAPVESAARSGWIPMALGRYPFHGNPGESLRWT